jgi:hypothetical protein
MTDHRPLPLTSRYRIIVKANDASRRRGFLWEIVSDDTGGVIQASRQSFKTLQRAYDDGCAALAQFGGD